MNTLTYTGTLIITSCWCGITLAIPDDLYKEAARIKRGVFCPLGHKFVYGNTTAEENEKLRARLERQEAETRVFRNRELAALKRVAAQKGANTRLRKRVAAGCCPACQRSFQNLARHMENRHPDYAKEKP